MAVSVRLEPLLEKELELAAKRLGVTKSQFIVDALERALGHKNPYELLLKVKAEVVANDFGLQANEGRFQGDLSDSQASRTFIRDKLKAKHQANQADWLAYHEAKRQGQQPWQAPEQRAEAP